MKFRIRKIEIYVVVIFFLLVSIGIGYSVINTKLVINGISSVAKTTWKVYFDNLVEYNGTLASSPAVISDDGTNISVGLTLERPGNHYYFTADIINSGTIDAKLETFEISGISEEQKKLLDYGVTYANDVEIRTGDLIVSGNSNKIKFYVKYRTNVDPDLLPTADSSLSIKVNMRYAQDDGNSISAKRLGVMMSRMAVADNVVSEYVTGESGIVFSELASATNGLGIYTVNSTLSDENPIHYYRGAVANNNVKFANFCWKIVRTTERGGVKLIYNGLPADDGSCSRTSTEVQIGVSKFNEAVTEAGAIADAGFRFGVRYTVANRTTTNTIGFIYANYVTYDKSTGLYTLQDTYTSTLGWATNYKEINTKYHYTCFSTGTTCSEVYYIYYGGLATHSYYIPMSNGKMINDLINEQTINTTNANDSVIKTVLDQWYKSNLTSYTDKLEDAIWCNDRSIYAYNGWDKDTSSANVDGFHYNGYGRIFLRYEPSVVCQNTSDKFTVNSSNGNGTLTYPVGLVTADEALFASGGKSYLNNDEDFWLLTPSYFAQDGAHNYYFTNDGLIIPLYTANTELGVRPAITLKNTMEVESGMGTVTDPYIIN